MNKKRIYLLLIICGMLGLGIASEALGAKKVFPSKPIELYCSFGAGGSTSIGARIIAGTLSEFLGNPVLVINNPAGAGTVAPAKVAKSKPDGYTLYVFNSGQNGITPAIRKISYKNSDFELLALYASQTIGLAVRADAPWRTLQELVAEAKKEPGKLKNAGPGNIGSPSTFSFELFKIAAGGLKIDEVPFKSGFDSMVALLGGHVHIVNVPAVEIKTFVDAGKVRLLAIATEKRLADFPDAPTFVESGYPEVIFSSWYGIAAPAGLPKEVSNTLKDALYKTIDHPEVKMMLTRVGFVPTFKNAEEFAKFVNEEQKKFEKIAKDAGIKMQE
jgi:tripartite-type tricarboxylate transporter receptor subunit TctC